jgi:thiol-disulfide isomerase/thioredoxin
MDEHAARDAPHRSPSFEHAAGRPLLLVVLALLVAGIAAGVLVARGGGIDAPDQTRSGTGASSGQPARAMPQFTATLRDGGTLASTDIKGPATIQVFASWCPSCQSHAPLVAQLQEEFDSLGAYYINVADEAAPADRFLDRYRWADAPVLVDDDRSISNAFGLNGQPHTIFVDADGKVAEVFPGGGELAALRAAAERVTAS